MSVEKDWMVSLASYIEGYATGLFHVECSLRWSDISGHREELVGLLGLLLLLITGGQGRGGKGKGRVGRGGRQKVSYISSSVI